MQPQICQKDTQVQFLLHYNNRFGLFFEFPGRNRLVAAAAKSLQSCPTLCDPIDCNPPGSPVLGFSRQEHWSGLPFLLQCMKVKSESEVAQSCPTLSDPMDCSPRGSPVPGILQARTLEWGAIALEVIQTSKGMKAYSKDPQGNPSPLIPWGGSPPRGSYWAFRLLDTDVSLCNFRGTPCLRLG